MQKQILKVKSNLKLNESTYELVLKGDSLNMNAGQFVEISIDGFFLRRPISVCDCNENELTIVFKVVGQGTKAMKNLKIDDELDVLTYLGNGFDVCAQKPLLIGGGIGSAPLYRLAKEFNLQGIEPNIILGFKNEQEIFYKDKFDKVGNLIIATDDGSYGFKGNSIGALKTFDIDFDKYYACGPMIMMKYLNQYSQEGQMSLEARMGCGFGACMGCSIQTKKGNKRVCKEGPVFDAKDLIFGEE